MTPQHRAPFGQAGRRALAIAASALVLILAVPAPAGAASPGAPSAASGTPVAIRPPAAFRAVCGTAAVGTARCLTLLRTDVAPRTTITAGASPAVTGYTPANLEAAYGLAAAAASSGTGATVAVVDAYDSPTAEADLKTYRAQFGLSACTTANGCFRKVDQNGGTSYPAADSGWALEISLDLDMVSAICPNCSILLVEAASNSFTDLGTAENRAVTMGAKYVSNSYGGPEDPSEATTVDAPYFDHPGVVITASSGDNGYGVEIPAASPHVIAVGGTTLNPPSGGGAWTETAWSGAGSGCSAYEPKPSWQHDSGCANRMVADVSAVADPATGVAVYDSGAKGWNLVGGTSASSPIIAAVYALAGAPLAATYPGAYPYARGGLNEVVGGSNGPCSPAPAYFCNGVAGYDGPTGLGSPSGVVPFSPPGAPGKPTGVAAVAGNASAVVSWSAPASNGGQPITGYTATSSPSGKTCAWTTGPLSCIVGALSNGTPYTFTVTATNATATGPASDPSAAVTPATVPGQPTGVAGLRGNGSVAVSWSAPASNGGAPVTAYLVTASPGGATCAWSSGPLSCTVWPLSNGTPYTFTVTATNAVGTGAPSAASSPVTPSAPPDKPTAVAASAGNASAQVTWFAPASSGGAPIAGYTVTSSPGALTCTWSAGPLTCTVGSLTNGVTYTFTVTATNVAGTGPASDPSNAATPQSVPGQPSITAVTPADASVLVAWSAPASDGGSPITGYTVTSAPDGHTCSWSSGPLSCTVGTLSNGTPYTFTVTATNGQGTGLPSMPSAAVNPATQPGPPTGVSAVPGTLSAVVSWSAPASNGGAPITGYTVTASPGGAECTWTSGPLTCTVGSLAGHTQYTFTVVASNRVGPGAPSFASSPVTANSLPGAPTAVTAVPAAPAYGSLAVSWTAPADDGGQAITSYTATAQPGGLACTTSGAIGCTITGLTPGMAETVRVTATTGIGTGPASDASAPTTPPTAPSASVAALPTWSLGTPVSVAWGATPGTNPVASYDVRYRRAAWNGGFGGFAVLRSATASTGAALAVTPGATYCLSVMARDTLGFPSPWSAERCTAVPLDDRSLARSGAWSTGTGRAYFRATWIRSAGLGSRATRSSVAATRIAIVVTTCPTCGSVRVYLGSTLLRSVSLRSSTTVNRKVIAIATFSSIRTGTVSIRVTSSGRRVLIDGLAISRT